MHTLAEVKPSNCSEFIPVPLPGTRRWPQGSFYQSTGFHCKCWPGKHTKSGMLPSARQDSPWIRSCLMLSAKLDTAS